MTLNKKSLLASATGLLAVLLAVALFVYLNAPSKPPAPTLTAVATASPVVGQGPLTRAFDASNSEPQGDIADFVWAFGDGQTAHGKTVIHTYAAAGTFSVTLSVRDVDGTSDQATMRILLRGGDDTLPVNPSQSMVLADFNADGKPDLAVVEFVDDRLSLLLGDGLGHFSATDNASGVARSGPRSVASADFNGDGRRDLALVNLGSGDVSVWFGDDEGSFSKAPGSPLAVGVNPVPVAVADFDRDGRPDLAVANGLADTVSVLLNAGGGAFVEAAGSPVHVGNGPRSLVSADFDHDGNADLAVANRFVDAISILLGDGTGRFTSAPSLATDSDPRALAAADFNRDGNLDLVVANAGSGTVVVFFGRGTGRFRRAPRAQAVGRGPVSVAVADLDHDQNVDLIVANAGSNNVSILRGDGQGGFEETSQSPLNAGTEPRSIGLGDLNVDGSLDLVVANRWVNTVTVFLADGRGGFVETRGSPFPVGRGTRSLVVADFDRDGRPEAVVTRAGEGQVTPSGIQGGVATGPTLLVGNDALAVTAGDFNGDQFTDLAFAHRVSDTVSVWFGDGKGAFVDAGNPEEVVPNPVSLAAADFDRDGHLDLAVVSGLVDSLSVLLGGGNGNFSEAPCSPLAVGAGPHDVAVGEFNADGRPDLVVASRFVNQVSIFLGTGTGCFDEPLVSIFFYLSPGLPSVAVGDFNVDGRDDLAVANQLDRTLNVFLSEGQGEFALAKGSPLTLEVAPSAISTWDVDRDGVLDLVVAGGVGGKLVVLSGDGVGGFSVAQEGPA